MDLTEEQYKQKYLKYKAKYIELKQQAGAEDELKACKFREGYKCSICKSCQKQKLFDWTKKENKVIQTRVCIKC